MNSNYPDQTHPIVWTIAGSDSGGGAGIQADLATFRDYSVYACTVITAVTAQNSVSVSEVGAVASDLVKSQLQALSADMTPLVIKIGMLACKHTLDVVVDYLQSYQGLVVCDPVLGASSGAALLDRDGGQALPESLFSYVDVLTPNLPEAEILLGRSIEGYAEMEAAAQDLLAFGCKAVLLTGGHAMLKAADGEERLACDYFTNGELSFWMETAWIDSEHSHGSGCTISSAIAAALAKGMDIEDAVVLAKAYVTQGIRAAKAIGKGPGPVAHTGFPSQRSDFPRVLKRYDLIGKTPDFKRCDTDALGLYPVVDSVEWLERLLKLGVKTIQLRAKNQTSDDLEQMVQQAVALQKTYQARLFINDYWQLAIQYGAYGVHLGQEDLDDADVFAIAAAGLRLGVSNHSYFELARAEALVPSYIAIGPIYPTKTKKMRWEQQGIEQLQQWVNLLDDAYPLVAIGGINRARAPEVLATGVGSVAMVTAITESEDYPAEVARLQALF
jgi:hydroxymethylpyrimidine kinase/phosphomethylpyrimidine kinase/thiamine-phosphate diphosphorylase